MTNILFKSSIRFFASAALAGCFALSARADPLPETPLDWQAPEQCPPTSFLRAEIARELEGSMAKREGIQVRAIATQVGFDAWQAELTIASSAGTSKRLLRAQTCRALAQATSLIVAMLIDPETAANRAVEPGVNDQAESQPAKPSKTSKPGTWRETTLPETPIAAPPLSPRPFAPIANERPLASRPTAGYLALNSGADWGSLPGATLTYGFAVGLLSGPWQAEVGLNWWATRHATINRPPAPAAGGSFRMMAAAATLCRGIWGAGRLAVSPCVGIELRDLFGEGNEAVAVPNHEHRWFTAAMISALSSIELSEVFSARLSIVASSPLVRPAFDISDLGRVHRPEWVSLRGTFGFEAHFR